MPGKKSLFSIVKEELKHRTGAHGFDHILRVRNYALEIAKKEHANRKTVEAMVLLHDLIRYEGEKEEESVTETLIKAKKILQKVNGYSSAEIKHILDGIKSHSLHSIVKSKPKTIEAKILFDADKLDSVGAIGIARWFTTMAQTTISIKQSAKIYLQTIEEQEKKLQNKLYTKSATKMVKQNLVYSKKFMRRLIKQM